MRRVLCIYHDNCADGVAAAWVVERGCPPNSNIDFVPAQYGDAPPDVKGKHVYIVDFSYDLDTLKEIACDAKSLVVLDHHQSSKDAVLELQWWARERGMNNVTCWHEQSLSGAMLAWRFFFPMRTAPKLIQHVQDRDLWRFKLSGTKAVMAHVFSYPLTVDNFDYLVGQFDYDRKEFERVGEAILRAHDKNVATVVERGAYISKLGEWEIPVCNAPGFFASDIGHILSKDYPFAAVYSIKDGTMLVSLRSAEDGADVAKVAERYGGGGHKHASGFTVSVDSEIAQRLMSKGRKYVKGETR